jgi:hypothetical protein
LTRRAADENVERVRDRSELKFLRKILRFGLSDIARQAVSLLAAMEVYAVRAGGVGIELYRATQGEAGGMEAERKAAATSE